jgi:hypothetical protein
MGLVGELMRFSRLGTTQIYLLSAMAKAGQALQSARTHNNKLKGYEQMIVPPPPRHDFNFLGCLHWPCVPDFQRIPGCAQNFTMFTLAKQEQRRLPVTQRSYPSASATQDVQDIERG